MNPTRLRKSLEKSLGAPLKRGWHTGKGQARYGWGVLTPMGGFWLGATLDAVAATIAQGGAR